jgi:Zn-dependent protease
MTMRDILISHFSSPFSGSPFGGYKSLADAAMDWRMWVMLAVAIVISTTVHEAAHAFVADKLGDPTPREAGRVTLNPLRHFDAVGAILMGVAIWTGLPIGWGKTVPVDGTKLREPKRTSMAIVAAAGPLANLATAVLFAGVLRIFLASGFATFNEWTLMALLTLVISVGLNVAQFVFNLIPVHPMDACTVLASCLPESIGVPFLAFMQKWGAVVMIALVYTHVLDGILMPLIVTIFRHLIGF